MINETVASFIRQFFYASVMNLIPILHVGTFSKDGDLSKMTLFKKNNKNKTI